MNPIFINGIGIISAAAKTSAELLELAKGDNFTENNFGKNTFEIGVPSSKVRRCPRYAKMAVSATNSALIDANFTDSIDKNRIGTIFSTGYGAVESTITFSDSVVDGVPSLCSPTVFSYTVFNSCLGQTCVVNGFKGVSTMILGGDPLEYSTLLLNTNKADLIISGAIEEYNEELKASILYDGILTDKIISEGAALFVLSRQENLNSYCKITKFSSASLEKYPYLYKLENDSTTEIISKILIDASKDKLPEVVLTQQNQSYFDEIEMAAMKKVFAENVNYFNAKSIFGETFNCSYSLNVAMAAAFIKIGRYKSALATGIDVHGNYLTALLEA